MRCTLHCLTAPSKCRGHPTGISESSSSLSPYCSITVPKSGTSMVALRLMCALLRCHVSKDNSPRVATSSRAAKVGCSRSGPASSRTDSRSQCMGSRPLANLAVVARATVSSSNGCSAPAAWGNGTLYGGTDSVGSAEFQNFKGKFQYLLLLQRLTWDLAWSAVLSCSWVTTGFWPRRIGRCFAPWVQVSSMEAQTPCSWLHRLLALFLALLPIAFLNLESQPLRHVRCKCLRVQGELEQRLTNVDAHIQELEAATKQASTRTERRFLCAVAKCSLDISGNAPCEEMSRVKVVHPMGDL